VTRKARLGRSKHSAMPGTRRTPRSRLARSGRRPGALPGKLGRRHLTRRSHPAGGSPVRPTAHLAGSVAGPALDRLKGLFSPATTGDRRDGPGHARRLLYGGRMSLVAGFLPTLVATVVGTLIGTGPALSRVRWARADAAMTCCTRSRHPPGHRGERGAGTWADECDCRGDRRVHPAGGSGGGAGNPVGGGPGVHGGRPITGAGRFKLLRTQLLPNVMNDIVVYAPAGRRGDGHRGQPELPGSGFAATDPGVGYMLEGLRGSIYLAPLLVVLPEFSSSSPRSRSHFQRRVARGNEHPTQLSTSGRERT